MNAIGYLRLSTKNQSKSWNIKNLSPGIIADETSSRFWIFLKDNGETSYTFEKQSFLELEKFIKKHKGKCQYLIVLDHDRFSRNLPKALMKIEELEKKYSVKVLSIPKRSRTSRSLK